MLFRFLCHNLVGRIQVSSNVVANLDFAPAKWLLIDFLEISAMWGISGELLDTVNTLLDIDILMPQIRGKNLSDE